ncbi:MAG: DUF4349 domain-containing protein [Bacteroidales bacterium]|nr:DUF4349 domain-containing protein [Bacteroidales bacterium]
MKTKIIFYSLIAIFFISCAKSGNDDLAYEPELDMDYFLPASSDKSTKAQIYTGEETGEINDPGNTEDGTEKIEKKIIKTADISFGVSDYNKSKPNINKIIAKHKGYITSESENNSSYSISNTIIIRVPAENFEKLLTDLEGEAEDFESKNINTSDVTEEYIDILTRLENKKKVEAQYIELLKKARTIAEILEVNEHIRRLREEIEAKEGRLKYLKNQVGLSTVTVYVHQDYDTVSYGFMHKVGDALGGGWEGFLGFIIGLLYIWPLLIIIAVIVFFVRKGIRKRRKLKAEKQSVTKTS